MRVATWLDQIMSLDYPPLDDEHRAFLDAINRTTQAVMKKHDMTGMPAMFKKCHYYCCTTLPAEADLMERIGYPGIKEHDAAHQQFFKDISKLRGDYEQAQTPNNKLEMAQRTMTYLSKWFPYHLIEFDKPIKPYLVRLRQLPPRMNY